MQLILILFIIIFMIPAPQVRAANMCGAFFTKIQGQPSSSFNEVVSIMQQGPYDSSQPPILPISMWRFVKGLPQLFVKQRSQEILEDKNDYRTEGQPKPIHPMGIGLTGILRTQPTRWSGLFAGGEFLVIARASISQDNPSMLKPNGEPQPRSTAMALKVFNTTDPEKAVKTANAVFQNDLNGLLGRDGQPLRFLNSPQTNHPSLNFFKIRRAYEVLTLLGIAVATFKNKFEQTGNSIPINPQIRPVHSLAELGVSDPSQVRTPIWVQIVPRLENHPINASDFRVEIAKTIERDGIIKYDIYAADTKDAQGRIQWMYAGELLFDTAILAKGVDQNLLFAHDTFNSPMTGRPFRIPTPSDQYKNVPDDIQ